MKHRQGPPACPLPAPREPSEKGLMKSSTQRDPSSMKGSASLFAFLVLLFVSVPAAWSASPDMHMTPYEHRIEPRQVRIMTDPDGVFVFDVSGNYMGPSSSGIIIPCIHHQVTLFLVKENFKEESRKDAQVGFRNNLLVIPPDYFKEHDAYPEKGKIKLQDLSLLKGGVRLSLIYLALIIILVLVPVVVIAAVVNKIMKRMRVYEKKLEETKRFSMAVTGTDIGTPVGTMGAISGKRLEGKYNNYIIKGVIGEGGMSTVYEGYRDTGDIMATNQALEMCAIKIVLPSIAKAPGYKERFRREIEVYRRLKHPSIVQIYDWGEEQSQGILFIVMEKITGKPLADIMKKKALDMKQAILWSLQILKALSFAHENNVVHRDIKPSNILITIARRVKLLDFGIARTTDTLSMTATDVALGTPHYLPPEQVDSKSVDGRADLYSFGIVLYQMLSGSLPFEGSSAFEVMKKHISEQPRPLSKVVAGVPPELEHVVMKLLEKKPDDRYGTAKEAADVLKQVALDSGIIAEKDISRTMMDGYITSQEKK
jgi:hypothetical protein